MCVCVCVVVGEEIMQGLLLGEHSRVHHQHTSADVMCEWEGDAMHLSRTTIKNSALAMATHMAAKRALAMQQPGRVR